LRLRNRWIEPVLRRKVCRGINVTGKIHYWYVVIGKEISPSPIPVNEIGEVEYIPCNLEGV